MFTAWGSIFIFSAFLVLFFHYLFGNSWAILAFLLVLSQQPPIQTSSAIASTANQLIWSATMLFPFVVSRAHSALSPALWEIPLAVFCFWIGALELRTFQTAFLFTLYGTTSVLSLILTIKTDSKSLVIQKISFAIAALLIPLILKLPKLSVSLGIYPFDPVKHWIWIPLIIAGFLIPYFRLRLARSPKRKDRVYYYTNFGAVLFTGSHWLFTDNFSMAQLFPICFTTLVVSGGFFISHLYAKSFSSQTRTIKIVSWSLVAIGAAITIWVNK